MSTNKNNKTCIKAPVSTKTQLFTLSFSMQYNGGWDLAGWIVSKKKSMPPTSFHKLFSKMTSKPPSAKRKRAVCVLIVGLNKLDQPGLVVIDFHRLILPHSFKAFPSS